MAQLLVHSGYKLAEDARRAEVIIVNTCGFIGPAKEESLQVLGDLAAHKRRGQLLIAAGCLTQRYGVEVVRQVPGIDGILGTRRWMDIVQVVGSLREGPHPSPLSPARRPDVGRMRLVRCAAACKAPARI
jgi:ribosomal protein S12 methylthiotransferase